jgi:hypothetical protein
MVSNPKGLGPDNDCAGEGQQQLQTTDPSSRQRERPKSTKQQLSDSNKNLVVGSGGVSVEIEPERVELKPLHC